MHFGLSAELCGRGGLATVALLCKKRVVPLILSSLEYTLCVELDLPDQLPRNIQLLTEVCERSGFTLVQPVPGTSTYRLRSGSRCIASPSWALSISCITVPGVSLAPSSSTNSPSSELSVSELR